MHANSQLRTAFDVVRQYDPALYGQMSGARWQVQTQPDDMRSLLAVMQSPTAFGITWHEGGGNPRSLINLAAIGEFAQSAGIPPRYMTAAVLAHEYRHTLQRQPHSQAEANSEEPAAYAAGRAFAAKLPPRYGQPIMAESDSDVGTYPH